MINTELPDNKIAIVGMAGRFPAARDVRAFWTMLSEGRAATQFLSDSELLAAGVSRRTIADPNYVRAANILPDMECFDAGFFGFSPREASILDPQHRHFLECGWEALEDAGHMPEDFDGRIGVYAGSGMQAYMPYNLLSNPDLVRDVGLFLLRHTGNDKDFLPTRLSYLLNLTGPSIAVQTACSTSLVAVHTAANALLNMECDMALAGGVTIELPHRVGYQYSDGEILSPDGRCRAFDDESQGTVFGSGAAIVALRRYEDAVADGDDIKAVILASAINNDGSGKASYLAPSVDGQTEAAAEALALAGVTPESISYIEAHGTGTPIGDPIELAALDQVYGGGAPGSIGVGSVKTNIGHLDTAAGGASLIKVVEALRHKRLPESLNFSKPNSRFDFAASPFYVVGEGRDWQDTGTPRRAAVNSLGVGGTNAHVIVEEAPEREEAGSDDAWRVFPFSARTATALAGTREKWQPFLKDCPPAMADMAFTLREGRRAFDERLAVAARMPEELAAALASKVSPLARQGKAGDEKPSIVFMFPGGGAQYPGAGAEMLAQSEVFAAAVDACFASLPEAAPADLRAMMFEPDLDDEEAREKLGRSGYAIPALFILEYAYAKLWQSWGVTPDAIFAHSVGEYAGAVIAGALGLKDALRVVTLRGQVMDAAPEGAMTTVPLGEAETVKLIGGDLDIAALNTGTTTVVSGQLSDIEALEARLGKCGHEARRIHIDVAAHSRQLEAELPRFRDGFDGVAFGELKIPMVSSLRGGWAEEDDFASADYWVRHLRHTVRFTDAVKAALDSPDRIVIEVGPGQTLGPLVEAAEIEHPARAILPSAPKPRDDADEMGVVMAALGGLWANGADVDWSKVPGSEGRRVSVPTYAFEKQRHWIEPGKGVAEDDTGDMPELTRAASLADWFEALSWEAAPLGGASADLAGRWLVFAGDDAVSGAVLAHLAEAGADTVVVRAGDTFAQEGDGFVIRPGVEEDAEALAGALEDFPARILSLWALDGAIAPAAFDSAYLLARALQQADAGSGTRLVFATTGAASVAGEAVANPALAALLGVVRVGPREIPGLSAALIDVDEAVPAAAIPAEAALDSGQDQIALRGAGRYVFRRQPSPGRDGEPVLLREGGVYVITGGTGGIGRLLARWMAETARAKVALVSRSAVADPDLQAAIEGAGGEVAFVAADITDADVVERVLGEVRGRFGEIHGVVHAAGVLNDGPLSVKSLGEARRVMDPKVKGGEILDRLLPVGSVDFFAVISSTSVVIGPAGQTDYVGANAALEALSAGRADGLSVAWGVWRDTGMAARAFGAGEALPGAQAHPLLGVRSEPGDGTIRFERMLDPDADWEVAEHVVGGQPVLPGTAYVERAFAAAGVVLGNEAFELASLSLSQPMIFADGMPRLVAVVLTPGEAGYELRVESRGGAGQQAFEHARVEVRTGGAGSVSVERFVAAEGLAASEGSGHAPQERLINFGPRWKNVGAVETGEGRARGEFALPSDFHGDLEDHPVHPALLDMAATVGLHALSAEARDGLVYAPMSAGKIQVLAPLPAQVVSHAVKVAEDHRKFVAFDVLITDMRGEPVLAIEHLALRAVQGGSLESAGSPASLTEQLLATGIRSSEAPELFDRVFAAGGRSIVVSPVSPDLVRLAMAEVHEVKPSADKQAGSGGTISDPVAAKLAGVWEEILGLSGIGLKDDFFGLGGHSLNAVRMFGRIRKEFGANLPLATLFEAPTVEALAGVIGEATGVAAPSAEATAPAAAEVRVAQTEPRDIPMTQGQREIASAILLNPEASLSYNLSFSLELKGALKPEAMERALAEIVSRHDSLRGTFDPEHLTVTIRPESAFALDTVDLSDLPAGQQDERRDGLRAGIAETAFDLKNGPVFKAVLVKFAEDRSELLLFVHHIACDGWSMGIVMRELCAAYNDLCAGRPFGLPEPVSIADFAAAERAWEETEEAESHKEFWLGKFRDGVPAADLPTDRSRPKVRTTAAGHVQKLIDPGLDARLRKLAGEAGTSVQNLLFAAFHLYVSRATGQSEVIIGLPSSGQLSHGVEEAVGHCVNFLPICCRADAGASLSDYLGHVRGEMLQALDHQNYSYGSLMRDLNIARDPSRVPIVPVIVNIDNLAEANALEFTGLETAFSAIPTGHEHFELFFNILDIPGRSALSWNYNRDLFEHETIEQHAENYLDLLSGLVEAENALATPVGAFFAGSTKPASGTFDDPGAAGLQVIPEVFRAVAARNRERVAVHFDDQAMDYATLDARSDALAAWLAAEGVGAGDLVGIASGRSLSLMVAVLGVLKAGAGYVPFDTALPEERLAFMARDTGIDILLGSCPAVAAAGVRTLAVEDFPAGPAEAPEPAISGESIAYVMFTSGTTGTPKGVVLPHRSVIRMLRDTDWLRLGPETVTLHSSAFAFDTSIIDIFGALLHGGTVVVPKDGTLSIADLSDAIESHGVNTLWLTSGLFHSVADMRPAAFTNVDQVIVGGDVVSPVHVAKVRKVCPGVTVINGYGPTESNVTNAHVISDHDLETGQPIPIGQAIPGTQIYIVDDRLRPVPPGLPGELCIAGRGLALGYWNRPELTEERFVSAPWDPGLKLYRSGDLAMNPGNGEVRFYGRIDSQVKIRGFRVELSEIEAVLEEHSAVRQAAAFAIVPDGQADKVIAVCYVPDGVPVTDRELADYAKAQLPDFARPTFFRQMDELPLNQNGKVDRRQLAGLPLMAPTAEVIELQTRTEERLAAIWSEILGHDAIGAASNFFEHGGHSLLAVRLFDRIRDEFGHDLPISTLLQNQTVRELSAVLDAAEPAAEGEETDADAPWDTSAVIHPGTKPGERPLFIVGGIGGNVNNLMELGREVGRVRPVIGFQTRGILGHAPHTSVEDIAADNIQYMLRHQPEGSYLLAGYSGGAITAFEMARQLEASGREVERLFILDTYAPNFATDFVPNVKVGLLGRLKQEVRVFREDGFVFLRRRVFKKTWKTLFNSRFRPLLRQASLSEYRLRAMEETWLAAASRYRGGDYGGPVSLFRTRPMRPVHRIAVEQDPTLGWSGIAEGRLDLTIVPGSHNTMVLGAGAARLAELIEERVPERGAEMAGEFRAAG